MSHTAARRTDEATGRTRPATRQGTRRARPAVLIGAAALTLGVALWPTASSQAAGTSTGGPSLDGISIAPQAALRVVGVLAHFQDDGDATPSALPCPGGTAIRGHATFGVRSGDTWHGSAVYDLCAVPARLPDSVTFTGVETFTGTVDGCGTGSVTYTVDHGVARRVSNPTLPNGYDIWTIVPGSGTGGLAGVGAGAGVGAYVIQPTRANAGAFIGHLFC